MKITTFTPTTPFPVFRGNDRIGVATGWGLTNGGFAVPVFANASVELQHGDIALVDEHKLAIGSADRKGVSLFADGGPETAKGPGRPPKEKPPVVTMGPWDIGFGEKQYKLISSWYFEDGDTALVFQIPSDRDTPDDPRVTKINRNKMNEMATETPVKTYEEVLGIAIPGSGGADDGDDDDDALDLV